MTQEENTPAQNFPSQNTMEQSATIARRYIQAVGAHDLDTVRGLLADDLSALFAGGTLGRDEWLGALKRLLPALVRNDIREVFADGDRACVVYDFVTDTPAGAVPCACARPLASISRKAPATSKAGAPVSPARVASGGTARSSALRSV